MLAFIRSIAICVFAVAAFLTPATVRATSVSACVGDCNGDGMVTVDELIRGINIALGSLSVTECPVFDSSHDGLVTVDEIVTAVANGLNGCPIVPTFTRTATAQGSATPTATATPGPPQPVTVLIATGMRIFQLSTIVTSLTTPVLSPGGDVLDLVEITMNESDMVQLLLSLSAGGGFPIILGQGQPIPNSTATIGSLAQPNGKPAGTFAFVDTDEGASLLRVDDASNILPVLGLGAPGARADFESRSFVVPVDGGFVVADVFAPGGNRALIAVDLDSTSAPIPLVTRGDSLSYRNGEGDLVSGNVTEIGAFFAESGNATAALVLDDATPVLATFSFDDDLLIDRRVVIAAGTQALALNPGATFETFEGGVRTGGTAGTRARGFLTSLSGTEFPGFSETAVYITDTDYAPLVIVQAGAPVPDVAEATIDRPRPPVMGLRGAAIAYGLVDDDTERAAIGFADYETQTFRTLVKAGDAAPGGGTFTSLPTSFAINANGDLVFRGDLGSAQSAYYAVSTNTAGAELRRLVGTGDTVALPEGGSAVITTLGMIPATGGLGGEATAVGATHFTVSASLDNEEGAVLLVEVGE